MGKIDDLTTPCVNSNIYTFWQEAASGEETGWYLATVITTNDRGDARLKNRKGNLIEDLSLGNTRWVPAKGNGKWFLPTLPDPTSAKMQADETDSKAHKVKAYADNLTTISSSHTDLQDIVSHADDRCRNMFKHQDRKNVTHYTLMGKKPRKNLPLVLVEVLPLTSRRSPPLSLDPM